MSDPIITPAYLAQRNLELVEKLTPFDNTTPLEVLEEAQEELNQLRNEVLGYVAGTDDDSPIDLLANIDGSTIELLKLKAALPADEDDNTVTAAKMDKFFNNKS
jgi:hypothetical protein